MSKYIVQATWDDVPHLSDQDKLDLINEIPPYLRDARSKGIPALGSGAIYPLAETDIAIKDFPIPSEYPRAFGMDVGWQFTAGVWGAKNPDDDIIYLYSVYKRSQAEPSIHADGFKARGNWIPGVIDPASRGRGQSDGEKLIDNYKNLGLDLHAADNAVEAGLYLVWQLLSAGRLKVFSSLLAWFEEFRMYRRDKKGAVVKVDDHLMDATRYLIMSGMNRARAKPAKPSWNEESKLTYSMPVYSWMG